MAGGNSKLRRWTRRRQQILQSNKNTSGSSLQQMIKPAKSNDLPKPKSATRRIFSRLYRFIEIAGVVLAPITIFFSFFPKLVVTDPTPLNSTGGFFSYRMDVKNEGPLPVFGVRCGLGIRDLKVGTAELLGGDNFLTEVFVQPDLIGTLRPGEAYTFTTERHPLFGGKPIEKADFAVVISYVPILPPIRRNVCVHFVLYTDATGAQHWFRSASGNCGQPKWFDYRDPQFPSQ